MKKAFFVFLSMVLLLGMGMFLISCGNDDNVDGGSEILDITETESGYALVGVKDKSITEIEIPEHVTEIGDKAFKGCDQLSSIVIPDGVTKIGYGAFWECGNLVSVTLGSSLTEIGIFAFAETNKLVEVINHSSLTVTPGDKDSNGRVGYYAITVHSGESQIVDRDGFLFYTCDGVNYLLGHNGKAETLILPENYGGQAYEIYKYAFFAKDAKEITIPECVTQIDENAFADCNAAINITIGTTALNADDMLYTVHDRLKSLTILDGVSLSIGEKAFYGHKYLESVVIGDGVTEIGKQAFAKCGLLRQIDIGDGVTSIGEGAFEQCDGLVSVTIGSGLTEMPIELFSDCVALEEAAICGGGLQLEYETFAGCKQLKRVELGNGVTEIGVCAFEDCVALEEIVIPEGVTVLGNSAFEGCTGLQSIVINGNIPKIESSMLDGCDNLESLVIGDGVTVIGKRVLEHHHNLKNLTIGSGVEVIEYGAFSGCPLTEIVIPDNVKSIGRDAFSSCYELSRAVIGNGVEAIDRFAFAYCYNLVSVTLGERVSEIAETAFYCSYKIVEIINRSELELSLGDTEHGYAPYYAKEIHSGENKVVDVDGYLFYTYGGVNYLLGYYGDETELVLPESYNGESYEIYGYAFYYAKDLQAVTVGANVTSIGKCAFTRCTELKSITVSESNPTYMSIDGNLYSKDGKTLIQYAIGKTDESFEIPKGVETVGEGAFHWSNLVSVSIGSSIKRIEIYAFDDCYALKQAEFAARSGWKLSETPDLKDDPWRSDVSEETLRDEETAATALGDYAVYYWEKVE